MGLEYYFPESEPVFDTTYHETGVAIPPKLLTGKKNAYLLCHLIQ